MSVETITETDPVPGTTRGESPESGSPVPGPTIHDLCAMVLERREAHFRREQRREWFASIREDAGTLIQLCKEAEGGIPR